MTESASRHSQFLSFIERLSQSARENTDVLGLVLVGSAAETFRADEWSDHDFFLIVNPTCGEKFRSDLSWLPSAEEIAFAARETDHGLKVVYKNAHVLEFAVFEDIELELASVNSWAVPVDKTNITERVRAIQARTNPRPFILETEWGLFLATILIAIGRARRGEILIAGQGIRTRAMNHALGFLRFARAPLVNTSKLEDNLDRFRRVEVQYPIESKILSDILQQPVEEATRALLDFVVTLDILNDELLLQGKVVRERLGWGIISP